MEKSWIVNISLGKWWEGVKKIVCDNMYIVYNERGEGCVVKYRHI
jgi:hypothetical protein